MGSGYILVQTDVKPERRQPRISTLLKWTFPCEQCRKRHKDVKQVQLVKVTILPGFW